MFVLLLKSIVLAYVFLKMFDGIILNQFLVYSFLIHMCFFDLNTSVYFITLQLCTAHFDESKKVSNKLLAFIISSKRFEPCLKFIKSSSRIHMAKKYITATGDIAQLVIENIYKQFFVH